MNSPAPLTTLGEVHAVWPDLENQTLVGIDLREADLDWSAARLDGASLLGCRLRPQDAVLIIGSDAVLQPPLGRAPFPVFRASLYTFEELAAVDPGSAKTFDERVGAWFQAAAPDSMHDTIVRSLHDATIEAAVARFVVGRRVVGVMGGHAVRRDSAAFREVARLGQALADAGFTVATGGGPGMMEAANLGAWLSAASPDDFETSLTTLAAQPSYADDPVAYLAAALQIRTAHPNGGDSLGVPTWVYLDEPTTGFATHIAKYFTNSIREDGLLSIARSGVVYTPGAAGTQQEIFTDCAQNSLNLQSVRSPMVFYGVEFYDGEHRELMDAVRQQATDFGWVHLILVTGDIDEAVSFISAHDPDAAGSAGVERRRVHGAV